jgi:hypothetical protein
MARKPRSKASGEFALFDVFCEDGTQRSNRKVPQKALMGQEGDELARAIIEEQDKAIAQKSGKAPVAIKRVQRSGEKTKRSSGLRRSVTTQPFSSMIASPLIPLGPAV